MALEIKDENFDSVLKSNNMVVVDFWASWCGPCRMIAPIVEELANENKDIIVGKMDITSNAETPVRYNVTSIPTLIFFVDGEEKHRVRGVNPKAKLQEIINSLKA
jgi:thioredoxin 1